MSGPPERCVYARMDSTDLTRLAPLILVPLMLRWLARHKAALAAREGEAHVMRYGRVWRVLAWGGLVLPATFALLPLVVPVEPGDLRFISLVGLLALAIAAWWLAEVYGRTFRLTPRGIEGRSPYRRGQAVAIAWADVAGAVYLPGSQALELRGRDGARVRISRYLGGFATLAAYLEAYGDRHLATTGVVERVRALQ
jgi:hypothetical protein